MIPGRPDAVLYVAAKSPSTHSAQPLGMIDEAEIFFNL